MIISRFTLLLILLTLDLVIALYVHLTKMEQKGTAISTTYLEKIILYTHGHYFVAVVRNDLLGFCLTLGLLVVLLIILICEITIILGFSASTKIEVQTNRIVIYVLVGIFLFSYICINWFFPA